MAKNERPKMEVQIGLRLAEAIHAGVVGAAEATGVGVPDLLREAAAAIARAHQRSRDGRVPKDMEIQQRYYPSFEEADWSTAEAPPGETINSVMQQSPREAAAYFAGRLVEQVIPHPHFVHPRSRAEFLARLREALLLEIQKLAQHEEPREKKRARRRESPRQLLLFPPANQSPILELPAPSCLIVEAEHYTEPCVCAFPDRWCVRRRQG